MRMGQDETDCGAHCHHTPTPTSPSICIICWEFLLVYDSEDPSRGPLPFVALKCGHLFHTNCVNKWFDTPQERNGPLKSCPYCRRKMRRCENSIMSPMFADEDLYREIMGQNDTRGGLRPAPTVCKLCFDFIMMYDNATKEDGGPLDQSKLRPMVRLRCGHYFHTSCINNNWFKRSWGNGSALKQCPTCQREMRPCDTMQIFPVSSGEE